MVEVTIYPENLDWEEYEPIDAGAARAWAARAIRVMAKSFILWFVQVLSWWCSSQGLKSQVDAWGGVLKILKKTCEDHCFIEDFPAVGGYFFSRTSAEFPGRQI